MNTVTELRALQVAVDREPANIESVVSKLDQINEIVSGKSKLPGYSFSSVANEAIESLPYLVKGVIAQGDVAFLFGDSGTLKSFVATDLAYHVASGINWHGFKVRQAGVLVVIGEGQAGYKKRIKAVINKYGRHDSPIWIVPQPVALDTEEALLKSWITKAEAELGCPIGLVLMDTFSLMMGCGDESSNADVSVALNNVRKAITGRAVLLIHHTGHGDKSRERGAYQIRGNADVRILIERDEGGTGKVITVTNLKSKDDRLFDPFNLGFEVVELGKDADGDPVTSLVIVPTNSLATKKDKEVRVGRALKYVQKAIEVCGSNEREKVQKTFMTIYPNTNKETTRSAFRTGWSQYMNLASEVSGGGEW